MTKKHFMKDQYKQKKDVVGLENEDELALRQIHLQNLISDLKLAHQKLRIIQKQLNCAMHNFSRAYVRLENAQHATFPEFEQVNKIANAQCEYNLRKRELDLATDKEADVSSLISELEDQMETLCGKIDPKTDARKLFGQVIVGLKQSFQNKNSTNSTHRLMG